jgi:acyl carrier protein
MNELITLIRTELKIETELDPTTPLLSSGIVDSLNVVVLLTAVEEHYGIDIDEAAVTAETFDTAEQILDQVQRELQ